MTKLKTMTILFKEQGNSHVFKVIIPLANCFALRRAIEHNLIILKVTFDQV